MTTTAQDHALVCRFTYPGGRTSRFIAVTRKPSEDGWFFLLKSERGGTPDVLLYQTIQSCDGEFQTITEQWTDQGFEFDREVKISIRQMMVDDSAVGWANSVLRPAMALLDTLDRPPFRHHGMVGASFDGRDGMWVAP